MLSTSAAVAPAAPRGVRRRTCMLSSPRMECASVEQTSFTPAASASRTCSPLRSSRDGETVDLERDVVLERDREDAVEVERVLGPAADVAALRVAEAAHGAGGAAPPRRAWSSRARGIRWPPCTLAWTQSSSARTSSGRSSRPSGRMSHSMPRRTRNGAQRLVGGGDLLGLAADVVGGQAAAPRRRPGVWSQIAR